MYFTSQLFLLNINDIRYFSDISPEKKNFTNGTVRVSENISTRSYTVTVTMTENSFVTMVKSHREKIDRQVGVKHVLGAHNSSKHRMIEK